MYYTIRNKEILTITPDQRKDGEICVGFLTMNELLDCYESLGLAESAINDCMNDSTHFRNSIDVYDDFSFGIINIVNMMNVYEERDRIGFFIKKDMFILVQIADMDNSVREMIESSIGRFKNNATLEKVIFGVLERLLAGGNKTLEITERSIIDMEQELVDGEIDTDLNRSIFDLKNQLSIQKNYYEQLILIGEELQENENDLFESDDLRYFKIFTDKAQRLSNSTQGLADNLVHLREALDAQLEYNLNSLMKVFTVVSTIFLPLTLIAGWYGMNFTHMPELTSKYGYPSVFVLSILVVVGCLIYFKRKKFF